MRATVILVGLYRIQEYKAADTIQLNVSILVTSIQTWPWGRLVLSIDMEHITLNSTTHFEVFGLTY